MSRLQREDAVRAFERARTSYNQQHLSRHERWNHSSRVDHSVVQFGRQLANTRRPLLTTLQHRLNRKRSEWNSDSETSRKSFNTHFLRELKQSNIRLYKQAIKQSFGISLLTTKDNQDIILYRSDSRGYQAIFKSGFQPKYAVSNELNKASRYAGTRYDNDVVTRDYGVSTSYRLAEAKRYGQVGHVANYVFTIRITSRDLKQHRLTAVDMVDTHRRYLSRDNYAWTKKEINFLCAIPRRYIASCTLADGAVIPNPHFAEPATSAARPEISRGTATPAASQQAAAAPSYDASTGAIHLARYSCDISVFKGQSDRVHCAFKDSPTAIRFIEAEQLHSERKPDQLKGIDSRRYPGLFTVRLNADQYRQVQSKNPALPDITEIKAGSAFQP